MRRALPFALGTLVATALLGFALRRGLQSTGGPDDDGVPDWSGWQVDLAHWGGIALAGALGLAVAVFAIRRARRLEGEGVLLGVPLLLGGLLLSGAVSGPFDAAQDWASHRTDAYRTEAAGFAAYRAEEKLHPVAVDFHKPPASPAFVALAPTAAELGAGWYDGQRPLVTEVHSLKGNPSARAFYTKASRSATGWNYDRMLMLRITDYGTPAAAHAWLTDLDTRFPNEAQHVDRRVAGVVFRVDLFKVPGGQSLNAKAIRGGKVWEVHLSAGGPKEPLTDAEMMQVLEVVAKHVA